MNSLKIWWRGTPGTIFGQFTIFLGKTWERLIAAVIAYAYLAG